ncbi:hypothetical protein [Mediterraneibacter gnavus]|uniref:hypothetical protein n=1 Tax=Mediterraneibacter gnavus TaxID=33038 RepID=UPI0035687D58
MKLTAFNATCPLEIGDRIITTPEGKEAVFMPRAAAVLVKGPAAVYTVTDIACTHYLKAGKVAFTYELDNSGKYRELDIKVL